MWHIYSNWISQVFTRCILFFSSVDSDVRENTDPFHPLTRWSKQVRLWFDVARRYHSVKAEHYWMGVRLRFLMYREQMHHSDPYGNVQAIWIRFDGQHFAKTYKDQQGIFRRDVRQFQCHHWTKRESSTYIRKISSDLVWLRICR